MNGCSIPKNSSPSYPGTPYAGVVDWGVNGAAYMAVPWSAWVFLCVLYLSQQNTSNEEATKEFLRLWNQILHPLEADVFWILQNLQRLARYGLFIVRPHRLE